MTSLFWVSPFAPGLRELGQVVSEVPTTSDIALVTDSKVPLCCSLHMPSLRIEVAFADSLKNSLTFECFHDGVVCSIRGRLQIQLGAVTAKH